MKKIRRQVITIRTFIPLLLLSLTLLFCLTTVSAAPGDTIYVNGSGGNDSWDGLSATWTSGTNGPKLSIKNATGTVNTNGTINIADGIYTGENNTKITIDRNMAIIGQRQTDTIINGEHVNWIFNIASGVNVTLQDLTLTNGNATANGFGGAIYNQGKLTTQNCSFLGNTASQGGAIFNFGGRSSSVITGCIFTNNTADQGGAIANVVLAFGARINSVITSCTFTNNTATDCGGAIFMMGGFNNDVQIHFNRIINNTGFDVYSFGMGTNATNNWWGSNFEATSPILAGKASDNVIVDSWVILSVNATPNNINNTKTSTVTADFNHINGGGDLVGGHIPDGPITLDIPWGSLIDSKQLGAYNTPAMYPCVMALNLGITHSITLNTIDGVIAAIFYANEGAVNPLFNPVKVTATADNYTTNNTESAYININKASDLYMKITSDKKNPKVGETFTLTYKLGNNGPDNATNVTINIPCLKALK